MNHIAQKIGIVSLGISLVIATSCNVPSKLTLPEDKKMPDTFIANTDTQKVVSLQLNEYYKDENLQFLFTKIKTENPDYQIVLRRMEIMNNYFLQRKAAFLPQVAGVINGSGTKYGKYTMDGVGNFDTNLSNNIEEDQKVKTNPVPNYFLGLNASWEVDLWGKLKNMKKAAQERFFASREGHNLLLTSLSSEVANLYFELITWDNELVILKENNALQEKALEIVKIQKEVGRATALAVSQFSAQNLNTKAAIIAVQQNIQHTEQALNALLGSFNEPIVRSKNIDLHAIEYLKKVGNPNQLLQNRPDLRSAFHELEATKADAHAARAAFYPSLNLSAYAALNAFSGKMLFSGSSFAGQLFGGLTAPILQQRQIKTNFNISKLNQEIAFFEYQKATLNAYKEVNSLIQFVDYNSKKYAMKNEEVALLKDAIEHADDLYVAGYATYLEIIAAQKSKLEADLALVNIKKSQAQSLVMLYKALGGGVH